MINENNLLKVIKISLNVFWFRLYVSFLWEIIILKSNTIVIINKILLSIISLNIWKMKDKEDENNLKISKINCIIFLLFLLIWFLIYIFIYFYSHSLFLSILFFLLYQRDSWEWFAKKERKIEEGREGKIVLESGLVSR